MSLAQQQADHYATVWTTFTTYGVDSPGQDLVPTFQTFARPGATVLDAGCGSGKGALALAAAGYDVTLCDLTDAGLLPEARALPFYTACLWKPLRSQVKRGAVDWVYCVDVLEHLPPQFTLLAVDQMLALATRGVFLGISLVPDNYGTWLGQPLHLTVQSFTWWRDALKELGTVVDARDQLIRGVYVVTR